jgi:hypothetical protein
MQFPRIPPVAGAAGGPINPEELISALQRGAARGIDPRHVLLTLGFTPAGNEAALDDPDEH